MIALVPPLYGDAAVAAGLLPEGWHERFVPRVGPPAHGGCWPWLGHVDPKGYAWTPWGSKYVFTAHRAAYLAWNGPLDPALVVDHLCGNRSCVCPWHLEQVAAAENTRRGRAKCNLAACKRGHSLVPPDVYITPAGTRVCQVCKRARRAEYRARRRAA